MAIFDKQGNVYKLRSPNKIMEKQTIWNMDKVRLINFGKNDVYVSSDEENIVSISQCESHENNYYDIEQNKILDSTQEEYVEQEDEKYIEQEILENTANQPPEIHIENSEVFYCLPSIGKKKHVDNLYGDSYETIVYGKQFTFEGVILDENDLYIQIWCGVKLKKGSIFYKRSNVGGERWWKVQEFEKQDKGYIIYAVVSDQNPYFE